MEVVGSMGLTQKLTKAQVAGNCCECGTRIYVGDFIQIIPETKELPRRAVCNGCATSTHGGKRGQGE